MHAREPVSEPFSDRAGAGLTRPAAPAGNRSAAAGIMAGATSRPARPCLFCRYRRVDDEQGAAAHA